MKLWLDDMRPAPEGWEWAKSVLEAKMLCRHNLFDEMSLDHDLGYYADEGGDGINFVDWLCDYGRQYPTVWPDKITVHSGNPVGRDNMMRAIDRFGPYNKGFGSFRYDKD